MQKAHTWAWLISKSVNSLDVAKLRDKGYGKCSLIEINYISEGNPARKHILCHNRQDIVRIETYTKGCEELC